MDKSQQPELAQLSPATTPILMEDFVFGGIEADETHLLANTRSLLGGLRHRYTLDPLDAQPGEPVKLTVFVGADVQLDQISAYVTVDGSDPAGRRGVASNGFVVPLHLADVGWEPLLWGYTQHWQGSIPGQAEGVYVRYRIEGWRSYDREFSLWSSEPNLDGTPERPTLYGYTVDRYDTPRWAREAVVYQVFVDRFAREDGQTLATYLPGEALNDFWGGTLRGVSEHLAEIADLGVTALWLSPIFVTESYHGYDTTDYYTVDPRFGTNDDLRQLVQEAHRRGLRVILDLVVNHTSLKFAPFVAAQSDVTSPYRSWFDFAPEYAHGYRSFFNVASMPQVNLDDPVARNYFLEVARFWLTEYEVDGYRLDYAAGPSHDFWAAFRQACKAAKAECWVFGEVTLAGEALRSYRGRLDGCLDFAFALSMRRLLVNRSVEDFAAEIERSTRFFNPGIEVHQPSRKVAPAHSPWFLRPAFLDNHDMNRFLFVVGDDKAKLQFATSLLFAFGETPILYYGTEVGLSQPRAKGPWSEESRHPMWWGAQQDSVLRDWFKRLIAFRRQHPALVYGDLRTLRLDAVEGVWVVERAVEGDRVVIVVNCGQQAQKVTLPAGQFYAIDHTAIAEGVSIAAETVLILASIRSP